MFTRRQTLGLIGAAASAAMLPQVRGARAQGATTLRIGWQKFGVLALAKRKGALEERLAGKGVNTYALDPGPVKTDLRRDAKGIIAKIAAPIANMVMSEPEEGAEAILYCALSNKCAGETGLMYRCNGLWEGAMEGAVDEAAAEKLWELSEKLVAQV